MHGGIEIRDENSNSILTSIAKSRYRDEPFAGIADEWSKEICYHEDSIVKNEHKWANRKVVLFLKDFGEDVLEGDESSEENEKMDSDNNDDLCDGVHS